MFVAVSKLSMVGAVFLVNVALIRVFGPAEFGAYSVVVAITGLVTAVASFGLPLLLVREVARTDATDPYPVGTPLRATFISSCVAIAISLGCVATWYGRPELILASLLAGMALACRAASETLVAVLHGRGKMHLDLTGVFISMVVLVAATVAALSAGTGIVGVFLAQLASAAVGFAIHGYLYLRKAGGLSLWTDPSEILPLLRRGVPFAAIVFLDGLYLRVDLLLMQAFKGDAALGLYRAASLVGSQLPYIALAVNAALYPHLAAKVERPQDAAAELARVLALLGVVAIPISGVGVALAEPLLISFAGPGYAPAAVAFGILMTVVPLRFMNNTLVYAMAALDRERGRLMAVAVASVVSIGLNVIAIPRFGLVGAAASAVATESALLGALVVLTRRAVPLRLPWRAYLRAMPALALTIGACELSSLPVLITCAVAFCIFALVSRLCGAWRFGDVRHLMSY